MKPRRARDLRIALTVGIVLGLALPAATFVALWGGKAPPWDPLPDRPGAAWVSIHPIQCDGNPWEEDWLRSNNGSAGLYPRDWGAQRGIILDFYARLGIRVFDARREEWDDPVCGACSCPAGYTLFLQVADEDIGDMTALGFTVVP